MPSGNPHPSTGDAIAICNGGNTGHCVEADDVVKHRLRRPGKMPGPGDPDDPDKEKEKDGEKKEGKAGNAPEGKASTPAVLKMKAKAD